MRLDPADIDLCINDFTSCGPHGGAPTSAPVIMTSLFSFPTLEELQAGLAAENRNNVYSRGQNPTVEELERKLAQLERGEECKCFGSGMAAISSVLLGLLKAGDHILFVNQIYGPTIQLATQMEDFGITHSIVLASDTNAVAAAITPATRMIWLESPGTMTFGLLDLSAIAALAKSRGIVTCIDNSWATPLLQKPITLGIDIVMHSCSKYINGHSDLLAGAIITNSELMRRIFYRGFMLLGGIMSPQDAWLILRGLRTLPTRLRQHAADGLAVANALAANAAVKQVLHPSLMPDPHGLRNQLTGYSGVFSFALSNPAVGNVRRVVNRLKHFRIGVSWGGVESIVISPFTEKNSARLVEQGLPEGLIRISVGLEGADVLIADLEQALAGD